MIETALFFGEDTSSSDTSDVPSKPRAPARPGFVGTLVLVAPLSSSSLVAEEHWAKMFPQSSTVFATHPDVQPAKAGAAPRALPATAKQLAVIQSFFGLSKTQLAKACKVQRQTVYDWYAGKFEAEGANARRLAELFAIARGLEEGGRRPLSAKLVRRALASGLTLLDLLTAEVIDADKVVRVFSALDAQNAQRRAKGAVALRERLGWARPTTQSENESLEDNLDTLVDG